MQGLITQNVDRLHHKAGSPGVLELHGTTHRVTCMGCGRETCRHELQRQLAGLNPEAAAAVAELSAQPWRGGGEEEDHERMLQLRVSRSGAVLPAWGP